MSINIKLKKVDQSVLTAHRYEVVYADPPWDCAQGRKHYPTMKLEDIKNLQIKTADDAVLYLWATTEKLPDAIEVMEAWGFKYITNSIWDKGHIGFGVWFRNQHELLLVGTKGNFPPPDESMRIGSALKYPRREHSRKPDEIRTLIEKWYPNAIRIELFARQQFQGWYCFGNETDKFNKEGWIEIIPLSLDETSTSSKPVIDIGISVPDDVSGGNPSSLPESVNKVVQDGTSNIDLEKSVLKEWYRRLGNLAVQTQRIYKSVVTKFLKSMTSPINKVDDEVDRFVKRYPGRPSQATALSAIRSLLKTVREVVLEPKKTKGDFREIGRINGQSVKGGSRDD
jgi:N6-adenosine-specific RNA methylase IME4